MAFAKLGMAYFIFIYLIGFVFYAIVYATLRAAAASWLKVSRLENRPRLIFVLAAVAAWSAVFGPLLLNRGLGGDWDFVLPVLIAGSHLIMDCRRSREQLLDPEEYYGDLLGFGTGAALMVALIVMKWKGW